MNVDRVAVTIKCDDDNSFVSLNKNYLALADFTSCVSKRNGRTWQCKGDGMGDNRMTFLAQPSDLNKLLSTIEYQSYSPNFVDNITISIYDGSGETEGPCMPEAEPERSPSIRTSCFVTEAKMSVQVGNYDPKDGYIPSTSGFFFGLELPYQAMLGILGGFMILICCILSCIKRRCKKSHKKRKAKREERKKEKEEEKRKLELPEIQGGDLEQGTRNARAKDAGAGFTNIAAKGLKTAHGGLDRVKATVGGVGGRVVGGP